MKFLAQPYYDPNEVKIYALPAATLAAALTDPTPAPGPNGVVLYQDSASVYYLFVSYDFGSTGAVDVYRFASIADLTTSPPSLGMPTRLNLSNSAVGMAVHPGTGDLYVATFSNGDGNGGVFHYAKSVTGYAFSAQFCSYADPVHNNAAFYCANLAFDSRGNLWMTSFNDADVTHQFLICFTQVYPTPDSSQFFKLTNGAQVAAADVTAVSVSSTPVPGPMYPLSQPEGIAFDPLGNLWLANNNDDFACNGPGNGTLVKIDRAFLDGQLLDNVTLTATLTADGFGGTQSMPTDPSQISVYYLEDARFGGLFFDGFTLYVNDQNAGGDAGNAVVWKCDSTLAATGFTVSGVSTTYPGNGTMAIFNSTPASLVVRDWSGDSGAEPDASLAGSGFSAWESCDIGVSQSSILSTLPGAGSPTALTSATPLLADSEVTGGEAAYAYVRVANLGTQESTGSEVLKLYWAKGSSALDWPQPWDGSLFADADKLIPLGGLVGAQQIHALSGNQEVFVEFPWATPNPANYATDSNHFCLLARIESSSLYPFGMTFPEQTGTTATQTPLIDNVVNNGKIGWRNITLMSNSGDRIKIENRTTRFLVGASAGNYGVRAANYALAFEILSRSRRPEQIRSHVVVRAEGLARQRMLEARFDERGCRHLGDGRFHLIDLANGIRNLRLHPGDTLPFDVEFTLEEAEEDFAIRFIQYVETEGERKVLGGQTFVVGEVEGFPFRKR